MIEWFLDLFRKPKKLLIWGIIEGPIRAEDVPELQLEDGSVGLVVKFSYGKQVSVGEFWFEDFDQAYEVVKHFHYTIEPFEMNAKDFQLDR